MLSFAFIFTKLYYALTFSGVQTVSQKDFGQNWQLLLSDEDSPPLLPSQTLPEQDP